MSCKKNEIGEHVKDKERFERIASVVLPIVILIGATVYLVLYLSYNTPLTLTDDSFYRQALVSAENSVPFAMHGASWLYPCLLHVMLLIFGNTPFAGIVLQIILFFICLLFLYIGMQAFAGVLPAAVSMAVFAFLPVSILFVFSLTPEFFYLAFYLLGFSLTGVFCREFEKTDSISPVQYLALFLLGLYIGFLIYLDIYSISLYFFFGIMYFSEEEKIKQAAGPGLMALSGGVSGFILSAAIVSRMADIRFSAYLRELFVVYTQNVGFVPDPLENAVLLPDTTLVGSLLVISFALLVILSFFIQKENKNGVFILNLLFVLALSIFSVFYLNEQMIITFSWSILAGLGLGGTVCRPKKSEKEKASKKESTEEKDSEKKITEQKQQKETMADISTKITLTEKKEQEKPAPGSPLHNPLPVPEKKKRLRADFNYPVKEEDMKFDIEVADDDDFDV